MNEKDFKQQVVTATKWSTITELAVKLINPITNIFLARMLTPEAFGVVATITMIVSFAEMFTDAGFQKYIVQHEFKNEKEKYDSINVAFWTNLAISFFIWSFIFIFRRKIAIIVGNPGLGFAIAISSLQLVLTAFSSIQMAIYRRNFDYKTLFLVRLVAVFIPFTVTLSLAYFGFGYWSLIIGTIVTQLSNAVILTLKSSWKPRFSFNFKLLKEMLSFSIWSLVEAISIWLTGWSDTFIIGSTLNQYYLGVYKTSTSMVNSLLSLVTGATTPILFSTLARLQDSKEEFNKVFLKVQRFVSMLVLPLGVGVYLYSDLATKILLGNQWSEASNVIGIWGLTGALMIVFSNYCSELYRAKGMPKLSFIAQVSHLLFLIPVIVISSKFGFWVLVYARSLSRFQLVFVHFIIMKWIIKFPLLDMFKSLFPVILSTSLMGILGYTLKIVAPTTIWSFFSIFLCTIFYLAILLSFSTIRAEIFILVRKFLRSK